MKTISIITPRGQRIPVANWQAGKLAFWRKAEGGAVFTELPAQSCKSVKQAAARIGKVYRAEAVVDLA